MGVGGGGVIDRFLQIYIHTIAGIKQFKTCIVVKTKMIVISPRSTILCEIIPHKRSIMHRGGRENRYRGQR